MNNESDNDKTHLSAKDLNEAKYKFLINSTD